MQLLHLPLVVALMAGGACDAHPDLIPADAQVAVEHARRGLGLVGDSQAVAVLVRLDAATLPFLALQLEGREAWRVDIVGPRWPSPGLPYVRALSALLAPDGTTVLRVISPWPEREPPIAPFPPTTVEERQLAAHDERFSVPPSHPAEVTLAGALAVIAANGGDLVQARQILAYHVVHDALRYHERPVWIVQLRGIPPFAAAGPGVPENARNHLRHIVDAKTGEWLGADTLPQPEGP
jgi:hypothetical protein